MSSGWRGPFYPKEMPKRLWLSYYSTQFTTTEINGSFYRTPTLDAVRHWGDSTSREFTFAWKASKFITHWKRLSVKCENFIALMETRLEALGLPGSVSTASQLFCGPSSIGRVHSDATKHETIRLRVSTSKLVS